MTSKRRYTLRIDIYSAMKQSSTVIVYDNFVLGGAADKYQLMSLGTYNGVGLHGEERPIGGVKLAKQTDG